MKGKTKSEYDSVRQMLMKAREATEREQDGYRDIIHTSIKDRNEGELVEAVKSGGFKGLNKIMKGYRCPPTIEERKSFLNVDDGQLFVTTALKKIPDTGIRSYMYHLNEVIEHTQRLRAMARFSKCVSPLKGPGRQLFHFWTRKSIVEILLLEANKLGKIDEIEMLKKLLEGLDMVISAQLECWDME